MPSSATRARSLAGRAVLRCGCAILALWALPAAVRADPAAPTAAQAGQLALPVGPGNPSAVDAATPVTFFAPGAPTAGEPAPVDRAAVLPVGDAAASTISAAVPREQGARGDPSPSASSAAARGSPAANPSAARAAERAAAFSRDLVVAVARYYQIDPALLHAIVTVESNYNPRAVSPRGAAGLMQVLPETARRYGARDIFDPAQNLAVGASYLRDLLARFDHDLGLALAAYNAGENAVIRYGNRIPPYPETQSYVPRVLAQYRVYTRFFAGH